MLRNIIKLLVLGTVAWVSWQTSSHYINEIVLELENRKPSITDMIIKQQVQESLKEAEKEIAKVQEEENIVIKQEEITVKPAKPPKVEESKPIEEARVDEEKTDIEITEEDVETPENVPNDALGDIDFSLYTQLGEEQIIYLAQHLIDHYFLFGADYYSVETDPVRYERKKLASDMEDQVIRSIGKLTGLLGNITQLQSKDIAPILEETTVIAKTFKESYVNVGEKGGEFKAIYDASNQYFDTYIDALTKVNQTFTNMETATNKALVLPILLNSINQDILPAIKDVLDQSFALKEKTNHIYIEGIEGKVLLSPEEVMAIIENPLSILPPELLPPPVTEQQLPPAEKEPTPPATEENIPPVVEETLPSEEEQPQETTTPNANIPSNEEPTISNEEVAPEA